MQGDVEPSATHCVAKEGDAGRNNRLAISCRIKTQTGNVIKTRRQYQTNMKHPHLYYPSPCVIMLMRGGEDK